MSVQRFIRLALARLVERFIEMVTTCYPMAVHYLDAGDLQQVLGRVGRNAMIESV